MGPGGPPGGPGQWGPPGGSLGPWGPPSPGPLPIFGGCGDFLCSCLSFLCCCWLLRDCFGGPPGPRPFGPPLP
ncbi:hypothetical protein vseg_021419 [Gypsophila vaccaria]